MTSSIPMVYSVSANKPALFTCIQYCVVDKERGELMIQEQSLPQPRKLENLMLCNTRACKPDFIDRNFCFRVS